MRSVVWVVSISYYGTSPDQTKVNKLDYQPLFWEGGGGGGEMGAVISITLLAECFFVASL